MSSAIRNACELAALLWGAAGVISCTLVSDFQVQECTSSADCDVLSGGIRHCEQSRCEPGCADNAHCSAVDPRFPLCQRFGGACVPLLTEAGQCSVASGYDERELERRTLADMDVVGAFASSARSSTWLSLELAASELNAARAAQSAPWARPLLLLLCNDSAPSVHLATRHLIQELGSRALIAADNESALRAALEESVTGEPAFLLNPAGSNLSVPSEMGPSDLLWHLGSDYIGTLPAYAQLFARALAVRDPATFHFASVVAEGPEDVALSDAVQAGLSIGARDFSGLLIDDRARVIHPPHELLADSTQGLERLLEYAPDLVLLFAGPEENPAALAPATIIELLEARTATLGVPPPLYILGPRSLEDLSLQALVAGRPSVRSRLVGVRADPIADPQLSAELRARFLAAYPVAPTQAQALGARASVYDALYLLSYGLAAAPRSDRPLSAVDVLAGFRRVTDDTASQPIDIGPGPERLEQGLQLLEGGASLRLDGASGPCHFEALEHTRPGPPRPYVIGPGGLLLDAEPSAAFAEASDLPD